ncbi:MAG: class I SAM-dependent methyltransferase [Verrucomicrobiales bacterium]|nr:class I SAM-dependent methyltransferase [Verrucomicrobiales bacterium]
MSESRLKVRLTRAAETAVKKGHPWVFADRIREQNRAGTLGEWAVVYDAQDRFLGMGLCDPHSVIGLRMLHVGKPVPMDAAWWRNRLESALAKRHGLFSPERTNGFRWINGESDGWPGLVLDRYADVLVMKLYTGIWLPRLEEVADLVCEALQPGSLVVRLSRNLEQRAAQQFGIRDGVRRGEPVERVVFLENGLQFEADVLRGQKTGFFLDQRENRQRVEGLAAGRTVLNAFSFSGGFSLYAARGGARSVTDLDLSAHALECARRNFLLNRGDARVAAVEHECIAADAFAWMDAGPRRQFDLIVCDPPSLAKREQERQGAIDAYHRLHFHALQRLRRGGVLVAASCSAHVSREEFLDAARRAAARTGRKVFELWTSANAPDHPAAFPEMQYLKCLALALDEPAASAAPRTESD